MPNLASAKQRALLASSSTFLSGRILHSVCPQVKSAAGLFKVSNKTRQEAIAVPSLMQRSTKSKSVKPQAHNVRFSFCHALLSIQICTWGLCTLYA